MPDNVAPVSFEQSEHRERRRVEREARLVDRFKTSYRGLHRVFAGHYGEGSPEVEALAYHLASAEAKLPTTREAMRLARYPGAGDRDPKRFAMGLWENVSVMQKHLTGAMDALEKLARNGGTTMADDDGDESVGFHDDDDDG